MKTIIMAVAVTIISHVYAIDLTEAIIKPEYKGKPYKRSYFKHWIDEDKDTQNTRHEVLIDESMIKVTFKTPMKRYVEKGKWVCEYTGKTFTNPSSLDIAHVVPLKEAWDSGAWEWDANKRKAFANDLQNPITLMGVDAKAKASKGAQDPHEWLPTHNKKKYVAWWSGIKLQWGLSFDTNEMKAIKKVLATKPTTKPPKKAWTNLGNGKWVINGNTFFFNRIKLKYPNGLVRKGTLSGPVTVTVGGVDYTFRRIYFYANGNVEGVRLTGPVTVTVGGVEYAFEAWIYFHADGNVKEGWLHRPHKVTIKGANYTFQWRIYFRENGNVYGGRLTEPHKVTIKGVEYTFEYDIHFHANGNVIQGKVGETVIRFYKDGTTNTEKLNAFDSDWTGELPTE